MSLSGAGLFPGQGSQSVGMGKSFFDNFKLAKDLFEEASDALSVNMKALCFEGPDSELQKTENTQPAIVLVSTVATQVARAEAGVSLQAAAGHSVGEYSALVAAGSLTLSEAVKLVKLRGQFMQEAVPQGQGAMAAVLGIEDQDIRLICAAASKESALGPLEPANFNCPGQVVISGSAKTLTWLKENATADWLGGVTSSRVSRLKMIPLAVSAPFHCSMMIPAEKKMQLVLNESPIKVSNFKVVQNFDAEVAVDSAGIRSRLVSQISGAVRWTDCQTRLIEQGIKTYFEFGNGKVLQGLAKKINPEIRVFGIQNTEDIKSLQTSGV